MKYITWVRPVREISRQLKKWPFRLSPEISIGILALFIAFSSCEKRDHGGDQAAIQNQAKAYETAFNRSDAKALAALWAEDAEYRQPETGEIISGRKEIEKAFQLTFRDLKKGEIELKIDSIAFPKTNQAIEKGIAIVKDEGQAISQTAYKAIYEKQQGEWLIKEVREFESPNPPTQYGQLKELDWLIGEWVDEDEDTTLLTRFDWDRYKNFLTQQFSLAVEGNLELEGKQIIAWDPVEGQIRSWIFDSDGGFGEGIWRKKDKSWEVESIYTLPDGRRASAIHIYTPFDTSHYTWESVGREVEGELLPDIEPVTVVKKKGSL